MNSLSAHNLSDKLSCNRILVFNRKPCKQITYTLLSHDESNRKGLFGTLMHLLSGDSDTETFLKNNIFETIDDS